MRSLSARRRGAGSRSASRASVHGRTGRRVPDGVSALTGLRRLFLKRLPTLVALCELRGMTRLSELHLGGNERLVVSAGPGGGIGGAPHLRDLRLTGTQIRTRACADAVLGLGQLRQLSLNFESDAGADVYWASWWQARLDGRCKIIAAQHQAHTDDDVWYDLPRGPDAKF